MSYLSRESVLPVLRSLVDREQMNSLPDIVPGVCPSLSINAVRGPATELPGHVEFRYHETRVDSSVPVGLSLLASGNRFPTQQVISRRRSADGSIVLHRKSTRRDGSPRSRSKTPTRQSGTKLTLPAAWQKSRSATAASETGLKEWWSLEEIKTVTEGIFSIVAVCRRQHPTKICSELSVAGSWSCEPWKAEYREGYEILRYGLVLSGECTE